MTLMSASFLLVVAGIVIAGPWLTVLAGRATLQFGRGATARLAGWRPSADPAAAFRSISGLIHAVLLASLISGVLPSVIGGQSRKSLPQPAGTVSAYLGGRQAPGLPPGPAQRLLHNLAKLPGVREPVGEPVDNHQVRTLSVLGATGTSPSRTCQNAENHRGRARTLHSSPAASRLACPDFHPDLSAFGAVAESGQSHIPLSAGVVPPARSPWHPITHCGRIRGC